MGRTRSQGMDYLQVLMEQLVTDEILFPEEADMVDRARLLAFAESSLGQRISGSRLVYRERPFNLLTKHDGKQIIVQGIIDCYFEEDDYLVLVDYKTGSAKGAEERYRMQIDLYRQALEAASGKKVKDAYLYMTDVGQIIKM